MTFPYRVFWCLLCGLLLFPALPARATDPMEGIKDAAVDNVFYKKAQEYYQAARYKEALDEFKKVLLRDPASILTHYYIGKTYDAMGLTPDAIDSYETIIKLNPMYYPAHEELAGIQSRRGNLEGAIDEYQKLSALKPQEASNYFQLGELYDKQGQRDKAAEYLSKGLALKEDNPGAASLLGEIYYQKYLKTKSNAEQSKWASKALEAFEQAYKYDKKNPEVGIWLASLYRIEGKLNESLEVLKGLVAREPTAELYYQIASTYLLLNDFEEAEEYNNRALTLQPEHLDAQDLARTLTDRKQFEEAQE